ncbi:S-layer homology domain-containing protein [Candidatus Gracilibacteria bacterium]|nr:S-layer homology domain-containing protein [Candidatus Gracilibacteria bacterium]
MKKTIISISIILLGFSGVLAGLKYQPLSQIDAANYLAEQSIIKDYRSNPDGFKLSKNITRQETIKVTMKLSETTIPEVCNGNFNDVTSGWGCKYIEAALKQGYIANNVNFRPNDLITKTEVAKLVLKAKNISKIRETKNWQKDYMDTLVHYGLIERAYSDYDTLATRGWIFSIVTATLKKEPEIIKEVEKKKKEIISDEA